VTREDAAGVDRATLLRRIAAGGAALSAPELLRARDAAAGTDATAAAGGNYPKHPKWKFVFVSHATTNPFFVPTRYGAADACALVGCSYTWGGSAKAAVREMMSAFNAAIAAKADGIAVAVIDAKAFEAPIKRALGNGIPVVSFNADGARGGAKARLAYIGQDLYDSGIAMGERIAAMLPKGDVAFFTASGGALTIQPRIDGAFAAIKQSGKPIDPKVVATTAQPDEELAAIDAYYLGHKTLTGMFAFDAGGTDSVGQVIQKHGLRGKVRGGGFDLSTGTPKLIDQGFLQFAIDQQPYLQGFYPVLQLFFYKLSDGLVAPSDVDTGLVFVTKTNVKPYVSTQTRYEGTSSAQKYPVS
jgi:simple sugar transport system substrate-binding protein